jgi:hypothetical protein
LIESGIHVGNTEKHPFEFSMLLVIHFGYIFVLQALYFSYIPKRRGISIRNATNLKKLVFVCSNECFIPCNEHFYN